MADSGEEKLVAVVRHIAKTLGGHNDDMTDNDILAIFSNFDGRLREKLTESAARQCNPRDDDDDDDDDEDESGCPEFEQTLKVLDRQISRYITAEQPIWSDSADAASSLDAVDELVTAIRDWTPMAGDQSVSSCLDRAEDLLQQAMFRLEDEFKTLMQQGTHSFDLTLFTAGKSASTNPFDSDEEMAVEKSESLSQPISDYDVEMDTLPAHIIDDLQKIAKRMVAAGYEKECSHAYSMCRREFLDECLSVLQLQKLSIDEIQKMQWPDLELEINNWIKAINVALRILFPSERRLCDRVFEGFASAADLSFVEICRGSTIQLLNFADAIAIGSRAPERLFKVLDVYEAIRDLMPEFELIFSDQDTVLDEAKTIWKRLGDAVRGMFMELENLICRDPAKAAVPGGGLHPITRYVMNYLSAACRSRKTLEQVFDASVVPCWDNGDHEEGDESVVSNSSSLTVLMACIMGLLESNLEAKSKIYRDSALCSVFMMNNGRYIVQKVKDSELHSLLGDDWVRKHTTKVRQCHVNYQRSSWTKVLGALKIDSSSSSPSGVSKTLKEKLKLFNSYFEETCRTQSTWVIFDDQLREELRISVAGTLSPAYRNFIGRLQSSPDFGKHTERHIKYSVDELEVRIYHLFEGYSGSGGGRK